VYSKPQLQIEDNFVVRPKRLGDLGNELKYFFRNCRVALLDAGMQKAVRMNDETEEVIEASITSCPVASPVAPVADAVAPPEVQLATAVASVARESSAAAPVPMLITPRLSHAPISRIDWYEKFEEMVNMALELDLERRPRLDRPGKVEIQIHMRKKADDEAKKRAAMPFIVSIFALK
jgi:hypothetical protein